MSNTLDQFREARAAYRIKAQEVEKELRAEMALKRIHLTSEEYEVMALLAQRAEAEGYSLKEIGQAYGTKNRKTIRDLLDYTVTDFDYTPPGRTKELHHYLDVIEVGDGRVTIKTNEPVPINLWEVADAPNDWEGSVTTDGAISDEYNVLWKELRSTNLPFLLGIRDLFDQ